MSAALAWVAGGAAALLQVSGAVATALPGPSLPVTPLALGVTALATLALLATRRWQVSAGLAPPLLAALALPVWLVAAAAWSPAPLTVAEKLPLVVLGPAMLALGLVLGAEATARRALVAATWLLALGLALCLLLVPPIGVPMGTTALNYQVAGLALASAAALAALRAVEAPSPLRALPWLALALGLGLAALVPGGRLALGALAAGVLLVPALSLALRGRRGAALAWLLATGGAGLALLAAMPDTLPAARTLDRLALVAEGLEVRALLWTEAVVQAGAGLPWGLGPGGFAPAAGHGDARGFHPHNHALEALAEGGLPGLLLWLGAFGGGALLMAMRLRAVEAGRAARILALTLPVGFSVLVSSDLGNRMAWFALGLALSLGLEARDA